jgi:hypothetical protein
MTTSRSATGLMSSLQDAGFVTFGAEDGGAALGRWSGARGWTR